MSSDIVTLLEMSEDGVPCDGYPAISYQLISFGQMDDRVVRPEDLPQGYRDDERPKFPGIKWVPKPAYGLRAQEWVALARGPGPQKIDYVICFRGTHFQMQEVMENGRRCPRIMSTAPCPLTSWHQEPSRVRVGMPKCDVPQEVLALIDPPSWLEKTLRRIAKLFSSAA